MSVSRVWRRKALVVEHNTWLRVMLTQLFEELGFVVTATSNGFGGLRLAIDLQPDVVAVGSALPELSSAQLAEELRGLRNTRAPGMQVIKTSELATLLSRPAWEQRK